METSVNHSRNINKKVTLRSKNQITIPNEAIEQLDLQKGDHFEVHIENGHVILVPVITIEKDQSWFWTREWQQAETEAQKDLDEGNFASFHSVEDLFNDLDNDKEK